MLVLQDGRPKRPAGGAYGCFLAAKRSEIAKSLPSGKVGEVGKAAHEQWRLLDSPQKRSYEDEYQTKLAEYQEAMEAYTEAKQGSIDSLDLIVMARPSKEARISGSRKALGDRPKEEKGRKESGSKCLAPVDVARPCKQPREGA
mmetsp:Transcript_16324/g.38627  ORF Transcript_16324/g.38627 Transcript_16324/m.38627 type:complete len:144 (-) Transcript_16324:12-443(-)